MLKSPFYQLAPWLIGMRETVCAMLFKGLQLLERLNYFPLKRAKAPQG
jgi:hypothetical protein